VLSSFNQIWVEGKDPITVLSELSALIRDIMVMHVAPKGGLDLLSGAHDTLALGSFAAALTTEQLICALNTVQRYIALMRDSKNIKTTAEICLISLCDSMLGEDIDALKARISKLEQQLQSGVIAPAAPVAAHESREAAVQYEEPPLPEEPYVPNVPVQRVQEPEEDEIDLAAFQEEQPEDAFLERRAREEVKTEPASDTGDIWAKICERVKPALTPEKRPMLGNSNSLTGKLNGDELRIEAQPGFVYGRFKDQAVLEKFAAAARELTGRAIRVTISELKQEQRERRDINELRSFPEVRFTK